MKYTLGDIGRILRWKKRIGPGAVSQEDGYQASEGTSPGMLCFLMTLYFTAYALQFYVFNLFLTKLPGNKFVNSCIFGSAEITSVFLSGWLMKRLSDMTVFKLIFVTGMLSYMIFIFFPDVHIGVIYLANSAFVGSMGGW